MGEIQIEILRSLIEERFGIAVTFDAGSIVYKETIRNTVEGVGHYEPLRHYSEVHLIMDRVNQAVVWCVTRSAVKISWIRTGRD